MAKDGFELCTCISTSKLYFGPPADRDFSLFQLLDINPVIYSVTSKYNTIAMRMIIIIILTLDHIVGYWQSDIWHTFHHKTLVT